MTPPIGLARWVSVLEHVSLAPLLRVTRRQPRFGIEVWSVRFLAGIQKLSVHTVFLPSSGRLLTRLRRGGGTVSGAQTRPARVGKLRPSQILLNYGIGALADLPNLSVIVTDLEDWPAQQGTPITEKRLLASIREVLGPQVRDLIAPRPAPDIPVGTLLDDAVHTVGAPYSFTWWVDQLGRRCEAIGTTPVIPSVTAPPPRTNLQVLAGRGAQIRTGWITRLRICWRCIPMILTSAGARLGGFAHRKSHGRCAWFLLIAAAGSKRHNFRPLVRGACHREWRSSRRQT